MLKIVESILLYWRWSRQKKTEPVKDRPAPQRCGGLSERKATVPCPWSGRGRWHSPAGWRCSPAPPSPHRGTHPHNRSLLGQTCSDSQLKVEIKSRLWVTLRAHISRPEAGPLVINRRCRCR